MRHSARVKQTVGEALKASAFIGGGIGYSIGQAVGFAAGAFGGILLGCAITSLVFGIAAFLLFLFHKAGRR